VLVTVALLHSQPCQVTCVCHAAHAGQTPNTSVVLQHALARPANLVMNVGDLTYAGKNGTRSIWHRLLSPPCASALQECLSLHLNPDIGATCTIGYRVLAYKCFSHGVHNALDRLGFDRQPCM
jgi:hypothetical protein